MKKILSPLILICLFILTVLLTAESVLAVDLDTARKTGLVGEAQNGYIGVVQSGASLDIHQLVNTVNAERRQAYHDVSLKNQQPLDVIEALAARKLIRNLGRGEYYKNNSGKWVRK